MPPQSNDTGTPLDWLRHAKSDLLVAGIQPPMGVMLETLCYHAQQSVEKSLKAVLLAHGVRFPYTHSLSLLISLSLDSDIAFPSELESASELTEYATGSRYPGDAEPVDAEEHELAVKMAQSVYDWAEKLIFSLTIKGAPYEPKHQPDSP